MVQEPVGRAEAERLGLVQKGEVVPVPDLTQFGVSLGSQFNHGVDATLDDVTPEIRAKAQKAIVARLGAGAIGPDGKPTLDALRQARAAIGRPVPPTPVPVVKTRKPRVVKIKPPVVPDPVVSTQTQGTTPSGSKVSEKIVFGTIKGSQQNVKQKWENAINAIDSVHGDGPLPPAPLMHETTGGSTNGQYSPWDNEITTFKENSIPMTLPHEIGHWIDNNGFKFIPEATPPTNAARQYASYSPLFKDFIAAAKKSERYIEIKNSNMVSRKAKAYFLSNHEIFARAYAQYIATKSKNPEMNAVLKTRQGKLSSSGGAIPTQWEDDDFVPIFNEIENIFKQLQWIKT
jgi:hypothetical protein